MQNCVSKQVKVVQRDSINMVCVTKIVKFVKKTFMKMLSPNKFRNALKIVAMLISHQHGKPI